MSRGVPVSAGSSNPNEVCDATADYLLGAQDYPRSIEVHVRLIAAHPDDALAHYHLGFAYGMIGRHRDELAEYLEAVGLGLKQWDLSLNLGRLYLEHGEFRAANSALTTAVILGPNHAEAHFNLALADERRGALGLAYDEIQTSLRLDAHQPDARNMLGVVCAEQGKIDERAGYGPILPHPNRISRPHAPISRSSNISSNRHIAVPQRKALLSHRLTRRPH